MKPNLIIISNQNMQQLLIKNINQHGEYCVNKSQDYKEILQDSNTYSLSNIIIMDYELDTELFKKLLYDLLQQDNIPTIIMLYEYLDSELKENLKKAGVDFFVQKPFQPARIWECLDIWNKSLKSKIKYPNLMIMEEILTNHTNEINLNKKTKELNNKIFSLRDSIKKKKSDDSYDLFNDDSLEIELTIDESIETNQTFNSNISSFDNIELDYSYSKNEELKKDTKYMDLPIYLKRTNSDSNESENIERFVDNNTVEDNKPINRLFKAIKIKKKGDE